MYEGLEHNKRLLPGIEQRSFDLPHRSLFPILTEVHRLPLLKVNILGHINTEEMQIKVLRFCPCSLLCSLTAFSLNSFSRGTAATPKQVSWYRSAWRRNRIRGVHNKLTDAVGPISCIIADWVAAYHFHT